MHPTGQASVSVTVALGQLAAMVAAGMGIVVAFMYSYTVAGARASSGDARVKEAQRQRIAAIDVQAGESMV